MYNYTMKERKVNDKQNNLHVFKQLYFLLKSQNLMKLLFQLSPDSE